MEEIQVISISIVTPTATVETHSCSRIELTPWDVTHLLQAGIQRGLLFHKPISQQAPESLIDHLKISLSRTLDFFPLLAGRLAKIENDNNTTSYFIDCNNEGAQFTHAIVDSLKVEDILEPIYVPHIVNSFFPLNEVCNYEGISQPLLAVQVTELEDGLFIGCYMNHCVVDGASFWHFFNSWSEISRGFSTLTRSPVLKRWFPDDSTYPIQIPNLQDEQILDKLIPKPIQERYFHFTKEKIAKLKAKANSEMSTQNISSLQALVSHIWRSVTRCRSLDANQQVFAIFLVGARERFEPPLNDGYFGNAVQGAILMTKSGQLLQNGLGWAAWEMNKMVREHTNETMKRYYEGFLKEPSLVPPGIMAGNFLLISSSPRHNVYGTDFGWGKPLAVRTGLGNKSDGIFSILPGVEEGSVDIEACLSREMLNALGNDRAFVEALYI